MEVLLPALILGFAGSLHCVGMCGPLLLALPFDTRSKVEIVTSLAVYHAGRLLMYALLGVVFGLIGQGLAVAGFQKGLSVTAGIVMISMALLSWRFEWLITALPGMGTLTKRVQSAMGRLLRDDPQKGHFALGALNGLLPCGMVYAALAGAIATADVQSGAVFMLLFGTGTLPLLLGVHVLGRTFGVWIRQHVRIAQPLLLLIAGVWLIQRGLHLDLSLFESAVPKAGADCH